MTGQSQSSRAIVILCIAILPWQSARAQAPMAASASARLVGDHWQLSVRPAAGDYTLTIDGKTVPHAASDSYSVQNLPRGLHKVEIDSTSQLRLLIRASGAKSTETKSTDAVAQTEAFQISVDAPIRGRPAPTFRVKQGDLVRLDWSSPTPTEVHLHGYDIEGHVAPDNPLSMIFEANLAGRFPAETHGKNGGPVAFLEVYPR